MVARPWPPVTSQVLLPERRRPASCRPPPHDTDPKDVWLAFGAQGGGDSSLFVVRADGSSLHPLNLGTSAGEPAFSPNGEVLAFAGPTGLMVMDLRTGAMSQVTTQAGDGTPAWSPDGKFLAFTRDVSIYVVAPDGSGERPYIQGPPPGQAWYSNYGHPAFTHDGLSLLFDSRGAVQIGNFDGSNVRNLITLGDGGIAMVALSPSGNALLLGGGCDGEGAIDIVPFANAGGFCGTDAGSPIASGAPATRPAWGANGLIAYVNEDMLTIAVVPASGGTPVQVTESTATGGGYVGDVAWSPPGTVLP